MLKPLDVLPEELDWLHKFASSGPNAGAIRQSLPIMGRAGELVVDGWTAFPMLEGSIERACGLRSPRSLAISRINTAESTDRLGLASADVTGSTSIDANVP